MRGYLALAGSRVRQKTRIDAMVSIREWLLRHLQVNDQFEVRTHRSAYSHRSSRYADTRATNDKTPTDRGEFSVHESNTMEALMRCLANDFRPLEQHHLDGAIVLATWERQQRFNAVLAAVFGEKATECLQKMHMLQSLLKQSDDCIYCDRTNNKPLCT